MSENDPKQSDPAPLPLPPLVEPFFGTFTDGNPRGFTRDDGAPESVLVREIKKRNQK